VLTKRQRNAWSKKELPARLKELEHLLPKAGSIARFAAGSLRASLAGLELDAYTIFSSFPQLAALQGA